MRLEELRPDYNPRYALWEKTVADVMQGDKDLTAYLQKALGYGLTGDTSEECFFLLYGPTTRNGKGTIMETYMKMLGGYGKAARPETIALRQNFNSSGSSEDIAKLAGARAVNISEPDKQMVLSAALVKTLTGNDTMTARFLNENSFEFKPQFKLFINTNHLPKANDVTIFTSGRVKVLPFSRHFDEDEQDMYVCGKHVESLDGWPGEWAMSQIVETEVDNTNKKIKLKGNIASAADTIDLTLLSFKPKEAGQENQPDTSMDFMGCIRIRLKKNGNSYEVAPNSQRPDGSYMECGGFNTVAAI